ncbi:MAG TPA: class I SAM-dependent methyltransferase [Anaerolineae bacterium]|nr:class I SAM-dependent methyltransferase [Anaerolineae bacterium]
MYDRIADLYDKVYSYKDYPVEARALTAFVRQELRSGGNRLLDVACGTGRHIEHLKREWRVEGVDLDQELLSIARQRNPDVLLHQADMADFELGRRFDAVTCLFSSIGYVRTLEKLGQAIGCMARHLVPGGVLAVEPWFTPSTWHPGTVHALLVDEPELKIARVNTSFMEGCLSYFDLHYLVGTPEGTEHLVERHEMGLFEREEMSGAFRAAGLSVRYDEQGLTGRGLYLGTLAPQVSTR